MWMRDEILSHRLQWKCHWVLLYTFDISDTKAYIPFQSFLHFPQESMYPSILFKLKISKRHLNKLKIFFLEQDTSEVNKFTCTFPLQHDCDET